MSDNTDTFDLGAFVKKHLKLISILGVIALVGIIVFSYFAYTISLRNEGERQEQTLTALYGTSINELSTCYDQGEVAAQVTEREYESIKEILVGATAARYVDASGNTTNASGALGGGQLISALQEQYPNIDQSSWQALQSLVIGCREDFLGSQNRILATAENYNQWRVSENMFNGWVLDEFPSDELRIVTASGETLYGMSAYDRIVRGVPVDKAIEAFETGELESQNLFGDE